MNNCDCGRNENLLRADCEHTCTVYWYLVRDEQRCLLDGWAAKKQLLEDEHEVPLPLRRERFVDDVCSVDDEQNVVDVH